MGRKLALAVATIVLVTPAESMSAPARAVGRVAVNDSFLTLSDAGGRPPSNRVALLVGISDYPGDDEDLGGGPINDVRLMRHLLITRFGFDSTNVLMLLDDQATRANIIDGFRTHLSKAGQEGAAVFFFSGHGAQLPNDDEDFERDALDEIIVVRGSAPNRLSALLDEEIGFLASELATDRVLVILDNCYAGTGTRGAARPIRWSNLFGQVQSPFPLVASRGGGRLSAGKRMAVSNTEGDIFESFDNLASEQPTEPSDHLLLSASGEDELSLNVPIVAEDGTRTALGLLTASLFLASTQEDFESLTFVNLVNSLRGSVRTVVARLREGPQTPQIEGAQKQTTIGTFLGKE